MPNTEIELNPIDFITIGTIGPKGRRQFMLQAGKGGQLVSVIIEKQQAHQLAEAVREMLADMGDTDKVNLDDFDMTLREPIEPQFRVANMGLGHDETHDRVILVARELIIVSDDSDIPDDISPSVVRFWGSRQQFRALSEHTFDVVEAGRADPKTNGHVIYYWT
ncbi:MAG: DUF3090 family protein [Anaerolineales bacterium]|nr:DUF3090 family protein [Anaerolineales bacterium]